MAEEIGDSVGFMLEDFDRFPESLDRMEETIAYSN